VTTTSPPPHLLGNFAPVPDELTVTDLQVTGTIPAGLTGWYLRNGPNPHQAASPHWFLGDGMVHGVRLDGGKATAYRNRWVRTSTLTKGAPLYNRLGIRDLAAGAANTHVIRHAGHTFALIDSSLPYELNCGEPDHMLDTIGVYDFGGRLRTPATAHPKTCPVTGELHFFGNSGAVGPYLTYHRTDASGELTISRPIDVPAATLMHDFHLTSQYVVFMDLPVVFDLGRARARTTGMPFLWKPDQGARLGVLRRDDPYGPVRWFEIEPCYVFHGLNAQDDGDRLILHVIRYDSLENGVYSSGPACLWRWTVNLAAGTVREEQLDDRDTEFPRIDDRLAGLAVRHGHTTTAPLAYRTATDDAPQRAAIHRYDFSDGTVVSHTFARGRTPGEAVFVPADGRPGGPGWLMTLVHDAATGYSELVILNADELTAPPVATVHIPRRVPFGFHGNWLPDT
jgi:carotenoid cleavage dioxygenase